ncbi:enoyl-CoA hydratase/isomerase family protein (plasmid) [Rhodococcus sp. USK10]|uniref:enoyl-CoA hydratase-related protein n=1 Tax=Rhodococcus sp. USK10 TaxID=2789739 RepID=UPI001C5CF096|nr:enoyl-CoA hydratase-related protein [Rhodococcus sp. USK10]QYA99623.1 enoyl-CoA hydratase/isomerase family protein [Rhodococcus sp. USK10]
MSEQILNSTRDGAVALLEINRPKAKNSLNTELLDALAAELTTLRTDENVLAVVISGAGGVFCAGADITAFDEIRAQPLVGGGTGATFWSILEAFPKPVIAAVEKFALGGGCELALACDIVIAGEGARFGVPEVKIGAIPGAGGTQRLIKAVGKPKAMALLLTGDFINAEHACAAGMVAEVVADGDTLAHATAMGQRIAQNSPLAVALVKDAALASFETSLRQGLEHEKRNFYVAVHSADSLEGQAAFLGKRAPHFTGK